MQTYKLILILGSVAALTGCANLVKHRLPIPNLPPVPPSPQVNFHLKLSPNNPVTASVTLGWDYDSQENTNVAGFRIYNGPGSRNYTNVTYAIGGLTRSATVTNLTRGITNYFAATAYTTSGLESDYSTELSYTPPLPPPPPTNIVVTVTLYSAQTLNSAWLPFTNFPSLSITNPTLPTDFFRVGITRTNF